MPSGLELGSAVISVATGLAVALLVEAVIGFRMLFRRRAAVSYVRDFLREFETTLAEVQPSDDGRVSKGEFQFALWKAHLDSSRLVISAHSPHLRRENFIEIMKVLDGQYRLTSIIPARKFPDQNFYDMYFERLRELGWLKRDPRQT